MLKCVQPTISSSNLAGRLIPLLTLLVVAPFVSLTARAGAGVPIIYNWTGQGVTSTLDDTGNWENNIAPPSTPWANDADITDIILHFGDTRRTVITDSDLYAHQLVFDAITAPYYLAGYSNTFHLGSGGIIYSPAGDIRTEFEGGLVQLHASQIWAINSGSVAIRSGISDTDDGSSLNYQIEKTGAGDLALESVYGSDWGGGLKLTDGRVVFVYDPGYTPQSSLGLGPLVFNGGTLRSRADYYSMGGHDAIHLANDIISNGLISLENDAPLHIDFDSQEIGNNLFRLDADTILDVKGAPLYIHRDVTETGGSRNLTLQSNSAVLLYEDSGWTGDTNIVAGALIFAGDDNTPSKPGGITISSHGYAGIGLDNDITTFLSKINQDDSRGTIGFDTDPDTSINTFTDPIDLTGFHEDIRLGSATSARIGSLTDTESHITPQGADYRFGGGGGLLQVATPLTDQITPSSAQRNLVVDSPAETPLTVLLLNTDNTVSGSVIVNDSALIFGEEVPLPGTTGNFTMNRGGYIGNLHDPEADGAEIPLTEYLGHFANDTLGIIGFDNNRTAYSTREVDLTGVSLAGFSNPFYLGTASALVDNMYGDIIGPGVRFTGTINAPADGVHRFAAYKGGFLAVGGTLTGSSAIIGSPDALGMFGDTTGMELSTVALTGNNAGHLTNGVAFYGGHLKVGQDTSDGIIGLDPSHALGEGTLSVMPVSFTLNDSGRNEQPHPLLSAAEDDVIINNPIHLGTDLSIGNDHDLTLGGIISGPGSLYVGGESFNDFSLTLEGDNSFTGDLHVLNDSTLNLFHDHATGQGMLRFSSEDELGASVYFNTTNPVVHGLENHQYYPSLHLNSTGPSTLTIDQAVDTQFSGDIYGDATYGSTLIKQGFGTLRYQSGSIDTMGINDGQGHNISLDIREGAFILGGDADVKAGTTIKLSGGTFATEDGVDVDNPILVSSGRLAGFGNYSSPVSIGAGAMLSPGLAGYGGTGTLFFDHLELNSGGIYEFSVRDPNPANPLGQDRVVVTGSNTLVINSTTLNPFVIKVVSLDPTGDLGTLEGIDFQHGLYSWTLFSYDSLSIPGNGGLFDASLFSLDLTEFNSDALHGGDFNLFQSGNNLMLGFTPVPEPSTYAMMALGLGIVAWTLRRRRRA